MSARRWLVRGAILAVMLAITACSKEQARQFMHDICVRMDNCTNYDEDGAPTDRWNP